MIAASLDGLATATPDADDSAVLDGLRLVALELADEIAALDEIFTDRENAQYEKHHPDIAALMATGHQRQSQAR